MVAAGTGFPQAGFVNDMAAEEVIDYCSPLPRRPSSCLLLTPDGTRGPMLGRMSLEL